MNVAVPTKQVQTGGHYEDASSSNSDTCSLQACTSSSTHNTSGTKTGTISCTQETVSTSSSSTASSIGSGSTSQIISCPNYVGNASPFAYLYGANSSYFMAEITNFTAPSASGDASLAVHVSATNPRYEDYRWNLSLGVNYTASSGYSGSSGGSWSPTPYYIDSIGPVTTNSGSGSISQYGTSGYTVAVSGASSSRVSYSFPYEGHYTTTSTSYKGSGSIRVPASYNITSVSSNKGSVSYSRSGDYVNYNVTSSISGSARVTAYYTYQYYVPTYSTYADVKFTGYYANGASAVNVNANSINFNGEIYP